MAYRAVLDMREFSARKVRPLANLVRGKFADEALEVLRFQPHRGARMLEKVIKSDVRQCTGHGSKQRSLLQRRRIVVVDARIDGGRCSSAFSRDREARPSRS